MMSNLWLRMMILIRQKPLAHLISNQGVKVYYISLVFASPTLFRYARSVDSRGSNARYIKGIY